MVAVAGHVSPVQLAAHAGLDVSPLQGEEGHEHVHQVLLDHPGVLQTPGLVERSRGHQRLKVFDGNFLQNTYLEEIIDKRS